MEKTKLMFLSVMLIGLMGISQIHAASAANNISQYGVNYLSDGNRYYESDDILEKDFAFFKQNGISIISIRVMWISIESSPGNYRTEVINNYKRVLSMAEKYNLKVNIDFWSHFHSFSTYWRPNYVTSNRAIYLDNSIKQAWFNMVKYVVNQLNGYSAINSWAVMNEPFYDYSSDRVPMERFIVECADLIRSLDNRPITCRFTVDYNPWNGLFDYDILDALDIVSITEYMSPDWSSSYHGATWNTIKQALEWCNQHNKDFWIIEFGTSSGSDETKRQYFNGSIEMFQELGIKTVFAWAWQSRSPQNEAYNIAEGVADPSPAFFELVTINTSNDSTSTKTPSTDLQTETSSDSVQQQTNSQQDSTSSEYVPTQRSHYQNTYYHPSDSYTRYSSRTYSQYSSTYSSRHYRSR